MDGQAQNGDTGFLLTADDAASAFEALLSDDSEEQQKPEAPPADDTPEEQDEEVEATDESQESEPSDTDESDDQPTEEENDEPPAPRTFRVKVDGEEVEVSEDELVRGYSRTADYTRKTQQLAEQRKQLEAELAPLRAERQRYAASLDQLDAALQAQAPQEPDWETLRNEDPAEFAATWALWQQYQTRQQAVRAERERVQQQVAADHVAQLRAQVDAERGKLLEALPAWKDSAVAKKERDELVAYAKASGYTDEELASVYDHRVLLVLRKAMLHDRAVKARPSVQQKIERVKVASPGTPASTKPKVTEVTRAKQRLAKTGRVDDAAAVFEQMDID